MITETRMSGKVLVYNARESFKRISEVPKSLGQPVTWSKAGGDGPQCDSVVTSFVEVTPKHLL
jgi:hypothetical protein